MCAVMQKCNFMNLSQHCDPVRGSKNPQQQFLICSWLITNLCFLGKNKLKIDLFSYRASVGETPVEDAPFNCRKHREHANSERRSRAHRPYK